MSDWKPGDVVMATVDDRHNVRLVAGWSKYDPQLRWCEMSPRWADGDDDECWFMPNRVTNHRPLVVIDPEDMGAVERLWRLAETTPAHFADALREFANPKPDAPTGWGAVVEDNTGALWTLFAPEADVWINYREGKRHYHSIPVVRVLSEGVRP